MDIQILPILDDNYAFVIQSGGQVGVIDPGEAAPFIEYLDKHGLSLDWVINTHHHSDHVDGNDELIKKHNAKWAAPAECGAADEVLVEGTPFQFGDTQFQIIHTCGHTKEHVVLYSADDSVLFSGDTVFASGCGRLFEGTAADMFDAFQKITQLPDDTVIYFGHEYTKSNCEFAAHALPHNQAIAQRLGEVTKQSVTIPTRLDVEKRVNPYFIAKDAAEFKKFRDAKDNF
jgi:hydroxyacylglutathione hydrolase